MDPLGSSTDICYINEVPTWNVSNVPSYPANNGHSLDKDVAFPCNPVINEKLIIWHGPIRKVQADAVVSIIPDKEKDSNTDDILMCPYEFEELSPEEKAEVKQCRSGEVRLTRSTVNNLSRYLIHTKGPNYYPKFHTAAESILYRCYRNLLLILIENNLKTVAIPPIHSRPSYPVELGAHIALRTIRRFLEKWCSSIHRILLIVPPIYKDDYIRLLPLYFPRNRSEELYSSKSLPDDIGDEDGEPVLPDREIRISANPVLRDAGGPSRASTSTSRHSEKDDDDDDEMGAYELEHAGEHAFAQMETDPDRRRRPHLYTMQSRLSTQRRYDRLLRKSLKVDLTGISALRCIYKCGIDSQGRPIILVVGRYFPALTINYRDAVLYFINLMDKIVSSSYIVIYLHTDTTSENQPPLSFLKEVYNFVDDRYKRNLCALYFVHTTWWARIVSWFFTTLSARAIKSRVHRVESLAQLYHSINPVQLDLPTFCYDYDKKISGPYYRTPSIPARVTSADL